MISITDTKTSKVERDSITGAPQLVLTCRITVACKFVSHSIEKEFVGEPKNSYFLYEEVRAWKDKIEQSLFETIVEAMK